MSVAGTDGGDHSVFSIEYSITRSQHGADHSIKGVTPRTPPIPPHPKSFLNLPPSRRFAELLPVSVPSRPTPRTGEAMDEQRALTDAARGHPDDALLVPVRPPVLHRSGTRGPQIPGRSPAEAERKPSAQGLRPRRYIRAKHPMDRQFPHGVSLCRPL